MEETVRLGMLYSNNMLNSNTKFKVLEGTNMINIVQNKEKKY